MSASTQPLPRPSGWKGKQGGNFWTKDSTYGVRYMCQTCRKETLGSGAAERMHYTTCAHYPHEKLAARAREEQEKRDRLSAAIRAVDWANVSVGVLESVVYTLRVNGVIETATPPEATP